MRDLLHVGGATAAALSGLGVKTIGDLAALDEQTLKARFGKHGLVLYTYAHGLDSDPVKAAGEQDEIKSVGNSLTYKRDLRTLEDIRIGLMPLAESVASRLRAHGLRCRGVQVAIKDPSLKTIDRQMQLPYATHLAKDLFDASMELVSRSWEVGRPIRLLSVTAINLTDAGAEEQLSLFEAPRDTGRQEALESSLDSIRERFGKSAVTPAVLLKNDLGIKT